MHEFKRDFEAPTSISVQCVRTLNNPAGPTGYEWEAEGYKFNDNIPSCYDPSFCETDPPVPTHDNVAYRKPIRGSMKYNDGKSVLYSCDNPGTPNILLLS